MRGQETFHILQRIAAAYSRFEVTELKAELWHEHLQHMPYDQVLARLNQHIANEKFAPTIAEISVKVPEKNEFLNEQSQWREQVRREKATGNHKTFMDHLTPEQQKKYSALMKKRG